MTFDLDDYNNVMKTTHSILSRELRLGDEVALWPYGQNHHERSVVTRMDESRVWFRLSSGGTIDLPHNNHFHRFYLSLDICEIPL